MTPERWQQIEALYRAVRERTPEQREPLFAGVDPGLRRDVESLLAGELTQAGTESLTVAAGGAAFLQLGPYKIEAKVGEGGMGEVFRAYDTRLHRTVAIKVLPHDKIADPGQKHRFLREARAASALNHPNIVTLHDIANDNGIEYLVMEFVSGRTLKQLIPAHGMALEELSEFGMQIASALAAAHAAGIVHRDIKPANIMVTPDRQVKVLDFGIAKRSPLMAGDAAGETKTVFEGTVPGVIVGTVAYMSPEQARGEQVDARSDIFSLGCVLYQAATGKLPFHGDSTLAVMHEIATTHPVEPSSLNPGIPLAFDLLIAKCMTKDPAQRLANASEIARELKLLRSSAQAAPQVQTGRMAVAVVPFRLRAGSPEDEFLSVALADAVIHRLSSTGKLLVRPIASVLRYKDADTEWTRVARDLNADVVVQGVIQKIGPKVRVLLEAFRASDSQTLHSAKHDGDIEDLFGLQDRIADTVSDVFVPRQKVAEESADPPTKNPRAYELYLRAVDRLAQMDKFNTEIAIELLTRVVDMDPNFADAWGRLAQAYTQMAMHLDPDPQWLQRAEEAIAKTLELDPVHCDALCARGQILWTPSRGYQNRAALRAMNAALKINPHRDVALQFRGAISFHLGFYAQAERDFKETLLWNPGSLLGIASQGMVALYRGDYEVARDVYERTLSLNPAQVHANIFWALPDILLGRLDAAREKLGKARRMVPEEPELTAQEGLILAREGNFRAAEEKADRALESKRSFTHTHHTWHDAAGVYSLCGKPEKALFQLRRCADMGLPNYLLFQSDPHLRSLHEHPDYQALMTNLRREHDQFQEEFSLG